MFSVLWSGGPLIAKQSIRYVAKAIELVDKSTRRSVPRLHTLHAPRETVDSQCVAHSAAALIWLLIPA